MVQPFCTSRLYLPHRERLVILGKSASAFLDWWNPAERRVVNTKKENVFGFSTNKKCHQRK
jgi:hypothetical protein